ncbi:Manganese/iron superoxide dismutase N-terminal, partial [Trinorchestia longiramus]
MADRDVYIAALERKLAELSGIEVDQIRKNQLANAADEARSIQQMADYVSGITVQQVAKAAQPSVINPQIDLIFEHIKAELGENKGEHALPPLQYDYKGLEPHISGLIMEIHHTKHHQGYINNLKAAVSKLDEARDKNDIASVNALFPALKFNGGGHLNHTIFWTNMAPNSSTTSPQPTGDLLKAIDAKFGSFQNFQ